MNGFMDKLLQTLKNNRMYMLLVILFFSTGVVVGTYTIRYMDDVNKTNLSTYFTRFIGSVSESNPNTAKLLLDSIKNNFLPLLLIFLLGFTFIGTPVILIINAIKGFTVGYSFTFLLTTFDNTGIGLALGAVLPQNLIYIPIFLIFSTVAISISMEKLKNKLKGINLNGDMNRNYFNIFIIFIVLFSIGIVVEAYISPNLIKYIVGKVYS